MLDSEKMREICERYYTDVYKFSFHFIRSEETAKDITQETFLLLSQKSDSLFDENIKSWLFSTAYRKIKNHRKTTFAELERYAPLEETTPADKSDSVESAAVRENIERLSFEAVSSLSEKDRELYNLRYKKELSCGEIASLLGESENTVYVRIHRMRKKVCEYINENIL